MSSGIFNNAIENILDALAGEPLSVALLTAWPSGPQAMQLSDLSYLSPAALGRSALPVVPGWEAAVVDGIVCRRNSAAVACGTLTQDVPRVVGWALCNSAGLIAWGPLVDSAGTDLARTFVAGDDLLIPAHELQIGMV